MNELERLAADIRKRRGIDTIVQFEPIAGPGPLGPATLDCFVKGLGLSPIESEWREVSRDQATLLAAAILAKDLAYGVQIISTDEAQEFGRHFISAFGNEAHFFTNTDYAIGATSWSWMPLTNSTFDAGVLGVDEQRIGVLVVQDED